MAKKKAFLLAGIVALLCLSNATGVFASFERGDDGQEVLAIQKRLAELNYSITYFDGDFGAETESAVRKFQGDNGLDVDGIIGSATYRALMNRDIPPNRGGNSLVRTILRAAYSALGTPYVFGGTSRYGFDCSGFTQFAFGSVGIYLPRTADSQMYYGRRVSMSELKPGDLLFYTTYEPGASHCGIYIGNGKFIHAGSSTGVTIAPAFTGYWGARYYGAARVI